MYILVLNGPNLNLLGKREPEIYGNQDLLDIEKRLRARFGTHTLEFIQSNDEGALVDALQSSANGHYDGVVLNAGAFSHTSYSIRDTIAAISAPVIEVHLSNIFGREEFRRKSVIAPVCRGMIAGFGALSYELAVEALIAFKK